MLKGYGIVFAVGLLVAADWKPTHSTNAILVPDVTYHLRMALQSNVSTLAVWSCHTGRSIVQAIPPSVLQITIICDRNCTASTYPRFSMVCAMPDRTFDAIIVDPSACSGGSMCTTQNVMGIITGKNQPKLLILADWQSHHLDMLELPSLKLHQFIGQATHEHTASRVFSDIYKRRAWGTHGGGSGLGSSLDYTANIRKALAELVAQRNITSIIDAPCGALAWMPVALATMPHNIRYTGLDVACPLISAHKMQFAERRNWDFFCVDVAHQSLPPNRDLIFSRDALQHLPFEYIFSFLSQVKASRARYLLVGSYVLSERPNMDIRIGDYFDINLLKPPFSVSPEPLMVINEETADGKHMLLFDVAAMQWGTPPMEGAAAPDTVTK